MAVANASSLVELSASWLVPAVARRADGIAIRPDQVKAGEIKLDGIPREWPSAMTNLGKTLSGSAGPDLGMRGAIAYDETNLYVGAEFKDDKLVRTASCGESEDHASLLIAFPRGGGGYSVHEIDLFPGDPGRAPGCVKSKARRRGRRWQDRRSPQGHTGRVHLRGGDPVEHVPRGRAHPGRPSRRASLCRR